ncbi:MAG: hypothetical protein K2Q14_08260 [Gammaproteobacteria bacterium]|nr:hypothetical protein [Gammaproteobacteria bacterium]
MELVRQKINKLNYDEFGKATLEPHHVEAFFIKNGGHRPDDGFDLWISRLLESTQSEIEEQLNYSVKNGFLLQISNEKDLRKYNIGNMTEPSEWDVRYRRNKSALIDENEEVINPTDDELRMLFQCYVYYITNFNKKFLDSIEQIIKKSQQGDKSFLIEFIENCEYEKIFLEKLIETQGKRFNEWKYEYVITEEIRVESYLEWLTRPILLDVINNEPESELAKAIPGVYRAILKAKTIDDLSPFVNQVDRKTLKLISKIHKLDENGDDYRLLSDFLCLYLPSEANLSIFKKQDLDYHLEKAKKLILRYVARQHIPMLNINTQLYNYPDTLKNLCIRSKEIRSKEAYGIIYTLLLLGANFTLLLDKLTHVPPMIQSINSLSKFSEFWVRAFTEHKSPNELNALAEWWFNVIKQAGQKSSFTNDIEARSFILDCEREVNLLGSLILNENQLLHTMAKSEQHRQNMKIFLNELTQFYIRFQSELSKAKAFNDDSELLKCLMNIMNYSKHVNNYSFVPKEIRKQLNKFSNVYKHYRNSESIVDNSIRILCENSEFLKNYSQPGMDDIASQGKAIWIAINVIKELDIRLYNQEELIRKTVEGMNQKIEEQGNKIEDQATKIHDQGKQIDILMKAEKERQDAQKMADLEHQQEIERTAARDAAYATQMQQMHTLAAAVQKMLLEQRTISSQQSGQEVNELVLGDRLNNFTTFNPGRAYGHFAMSPELSPENASEVNITSTENTPSTEDTNYYSYL